ncbi:MAG: ABC transporter ATP-binding protein [Candidatus Omnitrophica bacterium]|nr:ABC transporter ATP-binding protein [Candidatus Omnitrophota bacterium]
MIDIRSVEKRYPQGRGELTVLRGVSLRVGAGEIVAIVGPSGAGKSTLLHLIGGLDTPTAGEVQLEGQAWSALTPDAQARRRNALIGFVFQSYHLLPELTALENVLLPALVGAARGPVRAARARAEALLADVGLAGRRAHRPAELSGGEQQRVAIARALMNRPRLLLCDEPTGNLDTATGAEVLRVLMEEARRERMTVVMVTHEPALAQAAGRVVHMRDGEIVQPS